jgi:hypothetical protein
MSNTLPLTEFANKCEISMHYLESKHHDYMVLQFVSVGQGPLEIPSLWWSSVMKGRDGSCHFFKRKGNQRSLGYR